LHLAPCTWHQAPGKGPGNKVKPRCPRLTLDFGPAPLWIVHHGCYRRRRTLTPTLRLLPAIRTASNGNGLVGTRRIPTLRTRIGLSLWSTLTSETFTRPVPGLTVLLPHLSTKALVAWNVLTLSSLMKRYVKASNPGPREQTQTPGRSVQRKSRQKIPTPSRKTSLPILSPSRSREISHVQTRSQRHWASTLPRCLLLSLILVVIPRWIGVTLCQGPQILQPQAALQQGQRLPPPACSLRLSIPVPAQSSRFPPTPRLGLGPRIKSLNLRPSMGLRFTSWTWRTKRAHNAYEIR